MKSLLALIPLLCGTIVLFLLCDFDFESVLNTLHYLTPFDWHAVGVVFYCGMIIGWERMLRNKVLGMRTSVFVILGTYIFTAISMQVAEENSVADATRVIGQIVSGIGFLGAGVMFNRDNKVTGLTSAATIWVLAAIGVCIGVGYLATAVILSTVGVMLLIVVNEIDDVIVNFTKNLTATTPKYRVAVSSPVVPGYLDDEFFIQVKRGLFWRKLDSRVFSNKEEADSAVAKLIK